MSAAGIGPVKPSLRSFRITSFALRGVSLDIPDSYSLERRDLKARLERKQEVPLNDVSQISFCLFLCLTLCKKPRTFRYLSNDHAMFVAMIFCPFQGVLNVVKKGKDPNFIG